MRIYDHYRIKNSHDVHVCIEYVILEQDENILTFFLLRINKTCISVIKFTYQLHNQQATYEIQSISTKCLEGCLSNL